MTIPLPKELFQKLESIAEKNGFGSASNYIVSLLRKNLAGSTLETQALSPQEELQIRERLRTLGYLD